MKSKFQSRHNSQKLYHCNRHRENVSICITLNRIIVSVTMKRKLLMLCSRTSSYLVFQLRMDELYTLRILKSSFFSHKPITDDID